MAFTKKKVYFVGNAHLDPLWIWEWQEGSAEAKATIRSALDRMNEYPEFVFVCSAGRVFEWIEEFDPAMFAEIRARVKEGRFHLVGGWYVQPDCNNPSGESFARHGLYTQRYFREKFGVTATTGYNVDSFGHNANIPQLLKKAGMSRYIFQRPEQMEKELPTHVFFWEAPDGSRVLASRLTSHYSSGRGQFSSEEALDQALYAASCASDPKIEELLFFYGVGNHGGGPTKKHIEMIRDGRARYPETQFIYSTVDDFFDAVLQNDGPVLQTIKDEMQHHASGCYAANSKVKDAIRRAECAMTDAESAVMTAHALGLKPPMDTAYFAKLWKNVLFSHFHDSMGGCSTESAHEGVLRMLSASRYGADELKNNALQTVSWAIDTRDAMKGTPIVLFNPHGFPVETVIRVNKRLHHVFDREGREIPVQIVHGESKRVRKVYGDSIFAAKLPAYGYTTYYFKNEADPDAAPAKAASPARAQGFFLENDLIRVKFNEKTGYLQSIREKESGRELLRGPGAVPVVVDESKHDTWSHQMDFFDEEIGRMEADGIDTLECGPVRARVRVRAHYGASTLEQIFSLTPGSKELRVECRADWHEKQKMLKIRYEWDLDDPRASYEIPFSVIERPACGEEQPALRWMLAHDDTHGMAILNDSKYSSSMKGNAMDLTVLRSPYYIDHARMNDWTRFYTPSAERDADKEECELLDQGIQRFTYAVRPYEMSEGYHVLTERAALLNLPPTVILENNHAGTLQDAYSALQGTAENVVLSAFKRSEDGTGLILRAYETDGKDTETTFSGPALPVPLTAVFSHYAVDTWYLRDGTDKWEKVLFTEEAEARE